MSNKLFHLVVILRQSGLVTNLVERLVPDGLWDLFQRVTDRNGLPLSIGISAANTHDSQALEPLVRGIPPIRSRRGPRRRRRRRRPAKLHADKGYDYPHLRRWLRSRHITPRIARRGIESSERLGRHRWTVERSVSWLNGCRRLHRRYERKPEHFLSFAGIAATLTCYRRLTKRNSL